MNQINYINNLFTNIQIKSIKYELNYSSSYRLSIIKYEFKSVELNYINYKYTDHIYMN